MVDREILRAMRVTRIYEIKSKTPHRFPDAAFS